MDNLFLAYSKGKVFIYDKEKCKRITQANIPMPLWSKFFARIRVLERIFRLEPRLAFLDTQNNMCITYHGCIYKIDFYAKNVSAVYFFRPGMNAPLSVTTIKETANFHKQTVFGEYFDGAKSRVSIISENIYYKKVYEFVMGQINHIHGIVQDIYRDKVYILTGDTDEGSGIWESTDDFATVKPLLIGKQMYRCCVLFPTKTGLLYATDTPLEQNSIMFIDDTNKAKKIYDMPGPCIYGKEFIDIKGKTQYVFATSVEPDSRKEKWPYLFTCQKGPGVKDYYVHIIIGNLEDGFYEVDKLKKDVFPMTLGQFGNAQFPEGNSEKNLIFTACSVKHYDGKSIKIALEEKK